MNEIDKNVVLVKDLPDCCPSHDELVWNLHPRVFLLNKTPNINSVRCPYCSTLYLKN